MQPVTPDSGSPTVLDRILSPFASVRSGEGGTALLLMVNVFILLTAYYILKPVREALILGESGAEIKSYASGGQAALLLLIIPLYGRLASRVNRVWLVNGVIAFFASNLVLFFFLGRLGLSLGVVFYLWVGLFNVMLIAQFWAFANDVYTKPQGERLFGIVGIGASLGGILGALLAGWMFKPVGPYSMMLISAGLLVSSMILTNWIHLREKPAIAPERATSQPEQVGSEVRDGGKPLGTSGGFQLIFKSRYLLLIAFLVLISNCVNTTGEFILGKTVTTTAQAATQGAVDAEAASKNLIGEFYANFQFWVNLCSAAIQIFAASRIMQFLGAGRALLFLPLVALGGYSVLAIMPILGLIKIAKIAENSLDYSIQNTARHALFLPTSREAKYKAKSAIDSFFWRIGDTFSSLLVFTGTQLALNVRTFAAVNVVLVLVWLGIAIAIIRYLKNSQSTTRLAA
jgi:AAA family ATP:ADP antiporter